MNLTEINHLLLAQLKHIEVAVDMTVGNGYDTLFLIQHFPKVIGFDIQKQAIESTKEKCSDYTPTLIVDDHFNVDKYLSKADLFVFNLGWLPNSDKHICTSSYSITKTLDKCISLLNENGVISIISYQGDESQLRESIEIENWISDNKHLFVQKFSLPNSQNPPILYLLELKAQP